MKHSIYSWGYRNFFLLSFVLGLLIYQYTNTAHAQSIPPKNADISIANSATFAATSISNQSLGVEVNNQDQITLFLPLVDHTITPPDDVPEGNSLSISCQSSSPSDTSNINDSMTICPGQQVNGQVNQNGDEWDVYRVFSSAFTYAYIDLVGSGGTAEVYVFGPGYTDMLTAYPDVVLENPVSNNPAQVFIASTGYWYIAVNAAEGSTTYVLNVTSSPPITSCSSFPSGPTDSDSLGCVEGGAYEILRKNVSFSSAVCCGIPGTNYAIEAEARLTQGEGDYRLGFDLVDLFDGGAYLFGVKPRDGTYSLYRIDDDNWKGGTPLIDWTSSPHINRDNETNLLRVERYQAVIALYINDQQVATVEDSTYRESGVAWFLYARNYSQRNSAMEFNDISATALPDPPEASATRAASAEFSLTQPIID